MPVTDVDQIDIGDVDLLLQQLETLGALGTKVRCLLLLLKDGVNKSPCHIFTSRSPDELATIVIAESAPGFLSVSAVSPDSAAGHQQMAVLLRSPRVAELLWSRPFRADFVPAWMGPLLSCAAAERAARWHTGVTMQQFSQPPDHPTVPDQQSAGITLRPLDAVHLDTVKRFWPYAARAADADVIIHDGLLDGLSMGAFVDDVTSTPAEDGLVSWCVLNHNGSLAFLHTLESHRRRGLGGLVLAALTRLCQKRGYPCSVSTMLGPGCGTRAGRQLGYQLVGDVIVGRGGPADASQ